jgi:hypothetical protein
MPTNFYGPGLVSLLNKQIDFDTDVIKCSLHTSTYTPNRDTHRYQSDLTNEVASGNGYTTGGATLAGCSMAYTAANSLTAWVGSTAYKLNDVRRPATGNGYAYQAIVAGTSSGSAPVWPTVIGLTVTDGGVTWACIGRGVLVIDANDPSWANATITARYGVIYDSTPGTAGTNPLLLLIDFGSDQVSTNGTFSITFDAVGIAVIAVP